MKMGFRKFIGIGVIGIGIVSIGIVCSVSLNKPLQASSSPNPSVQVQSNKVIGNGWDLNVAKITFTSNGGNEKLADVDFSFINSKGLDKEISPKGKILSIVGTTGKIYEVNMKRTFDKTYTSSKPGRQKAAEQNGKAYEPGKYDFTIELTVDSAETNFTKVIYQDEKGNNFDVPTQNIEPIIATPPTEGK